MAGDKKSLKCRQSKCINSSITVYYLAKLKVRNRTIVIYIQYEFHEVTSITCKVMAEGRKKSLKV